MQKKRVSKEDPNKPLLLANAGEVSSYQKWESLPSKRGKQDCLQHSSIGCLKRMEHLISQHVRVNISSCVLGSASCHRCNHTSQTNVWGSARQYIIGRLQNTIANVNIALLWQEIQSTLIEPLNRFQILHFKSPCVCVCVYIYSYVYIYISKTCIHTCFPDNIKIVLVKCIRVHVSKWRFFVSLTNLYVQSVPALRNVYSSLTLKINVYNTHKTLDFGHWEKGNTKWLFVNEIPNLSKPHIKPENNFL